MQVIICKGLPGSGKTTFAREYCEKNTDWVRINRDDIRRMRGKYWLPKDEDFITDMERMCVATALNNGKNVVIDGTNLNTKFLNQMKHFILNVNADADIIEKTFDTSPEECIKRDAKRGEASVGADVIWDMYYKYIAPPQKYDENKNLRHAIIVDIDGTLAINNSGRSPYDWSRVNEDDVYTPIRNIVNWACDVRYIIVFSGRDSSCRELTEKWLTDNRINYNVLFMRATGDNRKDSIVKKELFEQHVRGQYYVDLVIDDRDQVVRMWRKELGLTCLQVNYGAF